MAESLSSAVGDALLALVEFVWPDASRWSERVAQQVADFVTPDPPFTLRTPEGEVVTGIVILDAGRAVFFFGTRQSRSSRTAHQAPERQYPERGYPERTYDGDQTVWPPRPYTR